jgi:hypothetical protein
MWDAARSAFALDRTIDFLSAGQDGAPGGWQACVVTLVRGIHRPGAGDEVVEPCFSCCSHVVIAMRKCEADESERRMPSRKF